MTKLRHTVRQTSRRVLTLPGIHRVYRPFLRDVAVIFMFHRFSDPDRGVDACDPDHLEECLAWLRRNDRPILDLEELVRRLVEGAELPPGAVCFTVDDGYYDFYAHGLDVFLRYDCPVTVFLPTGFIDGDCWLWWDRLEYVLTRTDRADLDPGPWAPPDTRPLRDQSDAQDAFGRLRQALDDLPEAEKRRRILELAEVAGVSLPDDPPSRYRPMSWREVRSAERRGARFGPHSVTHPALSRAESQQSRQEISESWSRVQEQVRRPVPVFCYPQGDIWASGRRESEFVRDTTGLLAAVGTRPRYVRTGHDGGDFRSRWNLPRFGFPARSTTDFVQIVSGLLRLRELVTPGGARRSSDAA